MPRVTRTYGLSESQKATGAGARWPGAAFPASSFPLHEEKIMFCHSTESQTLSSLDGECHAPFWWLKLLRHLRLPVGKSRSDANLPNNKENGGSRLRSATCSVNGKATHNCSVTTPGGPKKCKFLTVRYCSGTAAVMRWQPAAVHSHCKLFTRRGSDIVSSRRFSFATIYYDINTVLDYPAILLTEWFYH